MLFGLRAWFAPNAIRSFGPHVVRRPPVWILSASHPRHASKCVLRDAPRRGVGSPSEGHRPGCERRHRPTMFPPLRLSAQRAGRSPAARLFSGHRRPANTPPCLPCLPKPKSFRSREIEFPITLRPFDAIGDQTVPPVLLAAKWYAEGSWPLVVAILVFAVTQGATYWQMLLQSRRSLAAQLTMKRIDLISEQLAQFYNPLYALLAANGHIVEHLGPQTFPEDEIRAEAAAANWQAMKEKVILPNNRQVAEILRSKTHLMRPQMIFLVHPAKAYPRHEERAGIRRAVWQREYDASSPFRPETGKRHHTSLQSVCGRRMLGTTCNASVPGDVSSTSQVSFRRMNRNYQPPAGTPGLPKGTLIHADLR